MGCRAAIRIGVIGYFFIIMPYIMLNDKNAIDFNESYEYILVFGIPLLYVIIDLYLLHRSKQIARLNELKSIEEARKREEKFRESFDNIFKKYE